MSTWFIARNSVTAHKFHPTSSNLYKKIQDHSWHMHTSLIVGKKSNKILKFASLFIILFKNDLITHLHLLNMCILLAVLFSHAQTSSNPVPTFFSNVCPFFLRYCLYHTLHFLRCSGLKHFFLLIFIIIG